MINLLENYTLDQIVVFVVLLALAIKGLVTFLDWAQDRVLKQVDRSKIPSKLKDEIDAHEQELEKINDAILKLTDMVNLLLRSDRDDIKAFITRQHHYFCYQKGWIDDFSLDCIEKRFAHYQEQGGNTFIQNMMNELRALPRQQQDARSSLERKGE